MRDININVVCAHCGEILDTNEATRNDIDDHGELDLSCMEFHVGTQHECFEGDAEDEAIKISGRGNDDIDP